MESVIEIFKNNKLPRVEYLEGAFCNSCNAIISKCKNSDNFKMFDFSQFVECEIYDHEKNGTDRLVFLLRSIIIKYGITTPMKARNVKENEKNEIIIEFKSEKFPLTENKRWFDNEIGIYSIGDINKIIASGKVGKTIRYHNNDFHNDNIVGGPAEKARQISYLYDFEGRFEFNKDGGVDLIIKKDVCDTSLMKLSRRFIF